MSDTVSDTCTYPTPSYCSSLSLKSVVFYLNMDVFEPPHLADQGEQAIFLNKTGKILIFSL